MASDQKMRSNLHLAALFAATAFGMLCFSFAAVPFYSLFCKVTGFGGTTQHALKASESVGSKMITVRFNSDVAPDVPWVFKPEQVSVQVKTGENKLVFYYAENLTEEPFDGMAIYNVTPHKAGKYFNKVHCFCFERQTLKPKEQVIMPVSFFIDPDIETDRETRRVNTITLSYTFFKYQD